MLLRLSQSVSCAPALLLHLRRRKATGFSETTRGPVIGSLALSTVPRAGRSRSIRYDDGDKETVSLSDVRPYDWVIGMKVECNYKGAGDWYAGKITSLGGEKIGIAYDDGDKETTRTGRCRSR
ncbi:hypothetical protein pRL110057 (plasmid) [Rhizobium johnstonii 3841]|uniref:Agenet-like domain-containing protein n=1 Tax=Rhizobium johnstonii (strain DSM 114642 / LMG 32736 / 3841) TaxID=216596 RepID=Q1M6Y0_RHIJ3|nr:hypothetical protein pRL110057 [Rhizobium johnstonii 3841]